MPTPASPIGYVHAGKDWSGTPVMVSRLSTTRSTRHCDGMYRRLQDSCHNMQRRRHHHHDGNSHSAYINISIQAEYHCGKLCSQTEYQSIATYILAGDCEVCALYMSSMATNCISSHCLTQSPICEVVCGGIGSMEGERRIMSKQRGSFRSEIGAVTKQSPAHIHGSSVRLEGIGNSTFHHIKIHFTTPLYPAFVECRYRGPRKV